MSEKIDLAVAATHALYSRRVLIDSDDLLALVAAVRAALEFVKTEDPTIAMLLFVELEDALAPFTDSNDSAEVRSDADS